MNIDILPIYAQFVEYTKMVECYNKFLLSLSDIEVLAFWILDSLPEQCGEEFNQKRIAKMLHMSPEGARKTIQKIANKYQKCYSEYYIFNRLTIEEE